MFILSYTVYYKHWKPEKYQYPVFVLFFRRTCYTVTILHCTNLHMPVSLMNTFTQHFVYHNSFYSFTFS